MSWEEFYGADALRPGKMDDPSRLGPLLDELDRDCRRGLPVTPDDVRRVFADHLLLLGYTSEGDLLA